MVWCSMEEKDSVKQIEEFDAFVEDYNAIINRQTSFFNNDVDYFARYKVSLVRKLHSGTPEAILDYGCGIGNSTKHLCSLFPESEIYGFDISTLSLKEASRTIDKAIFTHDLDSISKKIDLVFVATVFHHIPVTEHQIVMDNIFKITNPGGKLFIFEHNPLNPVTRYIFNTSPIDRNAKMLAAPAIKKLMHKSGFKNIKLRYTLFFPQCLNKFRGLEKFLSLIPLGGQYLVSGEKPGQGT